MHSLVSIIFLKCDLYRIKNYKDFGFLNNIIAMAHYTVY
jgi:hypothetical protein